MATLAGQTIASSYEQLLSLPNGGGDNTTLVALTDGDAGTTFALKLATTSISINAAAKLYFDGGTHTYIQQSSANILDIYVGGVNMMKFTESAYPFVNVTGNVYIGSDGAGNSLVLYGTDTNSRIQLNVLPQIGVQDHSCGGANKSSLLFDSGTNVAGDAMSIDWNMSSSYLGANPSVQIKGTRGSASHSGILTLSTRGSSGYAPVITCSEDQKVGIGVSSGLVHKLDVVGTAGLSSGTAWTNTSDSRVKINIESISDGLTNINKLRPVSFNYTADYLEQHPEIDSTKRYNSFIAQEYADVFPDAVNKGGNLEKITTKGVDAITAVLDDGGNITTPAVEAVTEVKEILIEELFQFTPHDLNMYLVRAVQELSASNDALKARIEVLETV